jgi:hypothetical protein
VNHHVELVNSCGKFFNCSVIAHVQLFVSNARIGPVLQCFDVGDDDVCAVIEKGFCEGAANPAGTAGRSKCVGSNTFRNCALQQSEIN